MFSLGRSNRSSTATVVSRGVSPLSSDGRRLTISPSRRARIRTDSGRASGSNADGVITTRAIGLLRRQDAHGPQMFDGAAFNAAQKYFGVRRTADQERRRGALGPGMITR